MSNTRFPNLPLKLAGSLRMGEYIVQKGMIKVEDDLQKVLSFQQEQARLGKPYMLGQALLESKMLDRDFWIR